MNAPSNIVQNHSDKGQAQTITFGLAGGITLIELVEYAVNRVFRDGDTGVENSKYGVIILLI